MFGNERDVEVPALLRFVDEMQPASLLDVGAHWTSHTYAPEIRKRMTGRPYWAIDLAEDPETAAIVDRFIVGDLLKTHGVALLPGPIALVTCVSVVEHVEEKFGGSSKEFLQQLLRIPTSGLFLSFPFGAEGRVAGEYRNITQPELNQIMEMFDAAGFEPSIEFAVSDTPLLGRDAWYWTTARHAARIDLDASRGVRCVCMLTGRKRT